jgi:ribulose-5-phosphate 4-epimerase/fuculose-1-phosphate aldolase
MGDSEADIKTKLFKVAGTLAPSKLVDKAASSISLRVSEHTDVASFSSRSIEVI